MNTTKMRKLERLGVLTIKKKPNFSHRHTEEEYHSIIQSVITRLNRIQTILSDRLNTLQTRILGISITKLTEIYQCYFNTSAYRQSIKNDQLFRKSIRDLDNYSIRYLDQNLLKKEEMDNIVISLKTDYIQQMKYLLTIEDKLVEDKLDPFTNTFKMAHSSANV